MKKKIKEKLGFFTFKDESIMELFGGFKHASLFVKKFYEIGQRLRINCHFPAKHVWKAKFEN